MWDNMVFCLIFLSQILLISYYLPGKLHNRIRLIFETYPPSQYPRLYPEPAAVYEKAQLRYRNLNRLILLVGFILLVILYNDSTSEDWGGVVFAYFMLQFSPVILVEVWTSRHYKLMRRADSRTTRKAELQPRRLSDVFSPAMTGMALIVYFIFIVFIFYIEQFEFSWFGGYLNIVIITAVNLFFAGIILWNLYGKKRDPYQSYNDRISQIRRLAKQLIFISITATVYGMISVALNAFDLRHLVQIFMSLYFQLIAVMSFRTFPLIDNLDFEVYKEFPNAETSQTNG